MSRNMVMMKLFPRSLWAAGPQSSRLLSGLMLSVSSWELLTQQDMSARQEESDWFWVKLMWPWVDCSTTYTKRPMSFTTLMISALHLKTCLQRCTFNGESESIAGAINDSLSTIHYWCLITKKPEVLFRGEIPRIYSFDTILLFLCFICVWSPSPDVL